MFLFNVVAYVSMYIGLAFFALCLATGLYYLSELAEEFTVLTKKILKMVVITICAIHAILFLFDDLPLIQVSFGIFSHLIYALLLRRFPSVNIFSFPVIASFICFIASHILWYKYFTDYFTPAYDFYQLLGFFFTCVWLTPGGFFITLSMGDLSLPGLDTTGSGIYASTTTDYHHTIRNDMAGANKKRRNNVFTWFMSLVKGGKRNSNPSDGFMDKTL